MLARRSSSNLALGDFTMEWVKRSVKYGNEYWYMGSTVSRSEMAKKSAAVYVDTGSYCDRALDVWIKCE